MVLTVAIAVALTGFPTAPDTGFADRLLTAIGARTIGGTVSCSIPADLDVGRRFACHGVDDHGSYSVEVTILDRHHDFQLAIARAI